MKRILSICFLTPLLSLNCLLAKMPDKSVDNACLTANEQQNVPANPKEVQCPRDGRGDGKRCGGDEQCKCIKENVKTQIDMEEGKEKDNSDRN